MLEVWESYFLQNLAKEETEESDAASEYDNTNDNVVQHNFSGAPSTEARTDLQALEVDDQTGTLDVAEMVPHESPPQETFNHC